MKRNIFHLFILAKKAFCASPRLWPMSRPFFLAIIFLYSPIATRANIFSNGIKIVLSMLCLVRNTRGDVHNVVAQGTFLSPKIAWDKENRAVVVYRDNDTQSLGFLQCGDSQCNTVNVIKTLATGGDVGYEPDFVLDDEDIPYVTSRNATYNDLFFIQCKDPACAAINPPVYIDKKKQGLEPSIQLGTDGFPGISYYDVISQCLNFGKCSDKGCSTNFAINLIDDFGNVGRYSSQALDKAGNPMIVYHSISMGSLNFVQCTMPSCAYNTMFLLLDYDSQEEVGLSPFIRVRQDGSATIFYYDKTNGALKLYYCKQTGCTSTNDFSTIYSGAIAGKDFIYAAQINANDLPVIIYVDPNPPYNLMLMACERANCTGNPTFTEIGPIHGESTESTLALQLDGDGNAAMTYYNFSSNNLEFAEVTLFPTPSPTTTPSLSPSRRPSQSPTLFPTKSPTLFPSLAPSRLPSSSPSISPSKSPTRFPSLAPSRLPSSSPSISPSKSPTRFPSLAPSRLPSSSPSISPSKSPTRFPSLAPSRLPSSSPSISPSKSPTRFPSLAPSRLPSSSPSISPSKSPTRFPSLAPSRLPSSSPSISPSKSPTRFPSRTPSRLPSSSPSISPSKSPTRFPSRIPSRLSSSSPSISPSKSPTRFPSRIPSRLPSSSPSISPSGSSPTRFPSRTPSRLPSSTPSISLSKSPTLFPSRTPSRLPSSSPSISPSKSPTRFPSRTPSRLPSSPPSISPSKSPTRFPSRTPSRIPSSPPSISPSKTPSIAPSRFPSYTPTVTPSILPSAIPSSSPTHIPTRNPSIAHIAGHGARAMKSEESNNGILIALVVISGSFLVLSIVGCYIFLRYYKLKGEKEGEKEKIVESPVTHDNRKNFPLHKVQTHSFEQEKAPPLPDSTNTVMTNHTSSSYKKAFEYGEPENVREKKDNEKEFMKIVRLQKRELEKLASFSMQPSEQESADEEKESVNEEKESVDEEKEIVDDLSKKMEIHHEVDIEMSEIGVEEIRKQIREIGDFIISNSIQEDPSIELANAHHKEPGSLYYIDDNEIVSDEEIQYIQSVCQKNKEKNDGIDDFDLIAPDDIFDLIEDS